MNFHSTLLFENSRHKYVICNLSTQTKFKPVHCTVKTIYTMSVRIQLLLNSTYYDYNYFQHIFNDRFIPRRSNLDLDLSYYKLTSKDEFTRFDKPSDIFKQRPEDHYKRNYVNMLWSSLREDNKRVLSEGSGAKRECYEWPVRPRKKPLIKTPERILGTPYVLQTTGW